ncbi:MAG: peptide chain release factor N(5)-glutamine methyltransferase [Gemmatimonadales bacterium]
MTEPAGTGGSGPARAGTVLPGPLCLAEAAAALRSSGIPEPRREALRIWRDLADRPESDFVAAVERRADGEPLAYVTGQAGFRHLVLRADRRALIPRPETEQLAELALRVAPEGRAADIGTGTGCIALSLATEGRYHEVIAVDRSAAALSVARDNRARVGARRVHLVRGDLTAPLARGSLDLLVANPPYLTDGEWRRLDASVAKWEPSEALASGPDGLRDTRRLLEDGRRVVRPGGWLALELDCRRAAQVAELATALGWSGVQVTMDLFGRERFLLARRSDEP